MSENTKRNAWIDWPSRIIISAPYAVLCGFGAANSVASLVVGLYLGIPAGIVTFIFNLALFWIVVPDLFEKIFSKNNGLFHKQFWDGNKYVKHRQSGNILKVSWGRRLLIASMLFLAIIGALVYTGMLLANMTEMINFGSFFLMAAIPMFIASFLANVAFNSFDTVQKFAKEDLFSKIIPDFFKHLFLVQPDPSLKLPGEDPANSTLRIRQAVRLIIWTALLLLIAMALISISTQGAAGILNFFSLGQGSGVYHSFKPLLLVFGLAGMLPVAMTASYRFSSSLTRILTIASQAMTDFVYASFVTQNGYTQVTSRTICPILLIGTCRFIFNVVTLPIVALKKLAELIKNKFDAVTPYAPLETEMTATRSTLNTLGVVNAVNNGAIAMGSTSTVLSFTGVTQFFGGCTGSLMYLSNRNCQDDDEKAGQNAGELQIVDLPAPEH